MSAADARVPDIPATILPEDWRLAAFDDLDSTNDEALRRIASGERAGLVVVAAGQRAGRGRRAASWISDPGNLYMTAIVDGRGEAAAGELAYVAGLAAADAIDDAADIDVALKWPNDILFDGRKLGGILVEAGETSGLWAVGIGVNIVSAPDGTETPAGSLCEYGAPIDRDTLLSAVCRALAVRLSAWKRDGFAPLRQDWRARAWGLGRPLEARLADGTVERGVFSDIDENGALMLQRADGTVRAVSAGAVFFEEAS